MEYGRCQNGKEDFRNEMKDNLLYFHSYSKLNFVHGIYRKMYSILMSSSVEQYCYRSSQHLLFIHVLFFDKSRYLGWV